MVDLGGELPRVWRQGQSVSVELFQNAQKGHETVARHVKELLLQKHLRHPNLLALCFGHLRLNMLKPCRNS